MRPAHVVVAIATFLFVVVLGYQILNDEPKYCDKNERAKIAGLDLLTSRGVTRAEIGGPETGESVVLIHGVSGPMKVWDATYRTLVGKGLRVLRYDLFGRGLSDRVVGYYNSALYQNQLDEVITLAKLRKPVTLVGSSMGAIIATQYRNDHPADVKRVVLIGPAGFPIETSRLAGLMNWPGIGEFLMGVAGKRTLLGHNSRYFVAPEKFPELTDAYRDQLKYKGSKKAILSTMREMPVQDFEFGYRELGKSQTPVILVWGKQDQTFPFSHHVAAQRYLPQAQFLAVDGAGHLPQYEQPEIVNKFLISHLPD